MSTPNIRDLIDDALTTGIGKDWPDAATALLGTLGYRSELTPLGQTGDVGDFVRAYPALHPDTRSEQAFLAHAESVQILFQFTEAEIQAETQQALFDTSSFDRGNAHSFLFAAVQLRPRRSGDYTRTQYADFTRELNKRIQLPTVVLFRTANDRVTLACVLRRSNKLKPERDVLESVSLIREIDPANPHRAHRDILAELSLPTRLKWMDTHGKSHNFDGLLDAWLAALDTEELNKRFYRKLYRWFERSLEIAEFPTRQAKALRKEEHVVRLITRLMFVWFIKEKGLVAEDLFIKNQVAQLLKDYDCDRGDSYYRVVLQNLFFATLNTEIPQRRFINPACDDHSDPALYRYRDEIAEPERLLDLFRKTPFINGGLFDCLDSHDTQGEDSVLVDCFTDNPQHRAGYSIPNRLFFNDDADPGLIDLFNRYKFTVEENTPTEQEVALDPELLGKVFENLLAAVNPETQLSARKETGSYYTPRAVVDYMVNEALLATLAQKAVPDDGDVDFWQERLRYLLDYGDAFADAEDLFTPTEQEAVVRAVSSLKILDPAVGSGAFPMGVLHKLTLILRRLDPRNQLWESLQKELAGQRAAAAFDTEDQVERESELADISRTFDKYRDSDFGRKLYLIQNSIYGVDIQPVATQIAKLRFFISLAIEQEPTEDDNDNYGIKPLPNLETRFVAANTLLALDRPTQMTIGQTDEVMWIERKLTVNRERYFHANTRSAKMDSRSKDANLRQQLAQELQASGLSAGAANQLGDWEPFDQNADAANWFDAEYMFGVDSGFDVSIGNPPYVRSEGSNEKQQMRDLIDDSGLYETLYEKWDLYIPFIERAYKLLKPNGFTTMIVSDAYCHSRYAKRSREWFLNNSRIMRLDFFGKIQIFEAGVRNIVYLFQKADGQRNEPERRVHFPEFGQVEYLPTNEQRNLTDRVFFPEDVEAKAATAPTIDLQSICYVSYGLRPSSKPDATDKFVTEDLTSSIKELPHDRPYVDGKHLAAWLPKEHLWIEWGTHRSPRRFYAPTFPELHDTSEKILVKKNCGITPMACYDNQCLVFSASAIGLLTWQSLAGIRNNSIKKQARYQNEKQLPNLPSRENLEMLSKRFSIRFLLGVLNSTFVADFLRANRRHNVSLYPNDWKQLPIPDVSLEQQKPIITYVDRILKAKAANPAADIGADEAEIDRLVYVLYGLTNAEVAVVEGIG